MLESTACKAQRSKTVLRVALVALGLLMVPLVASRVVDGWHWPAGAFVFVYLLFFGTGLAYVSIARRVDMWSYKAGTAVALVTGFLLAWFTRVQVADSGNPANLMYYVVLVIGGVGAWLSRLEARGLARTLFTMAATFALIAILLPSGAPPDLARTMAVSHCVSVVLFTAAGLLFRHASLVKSSSY